MEYIYMIHSIHLTVPVHCRDRVSHLHSGQHSHHISQFRSHGLKISETKKPKKIRALKLDRDVTILNLYPAISVYQNPECWQ